MTSRPDGPESVAPPASQPTALVFDEIYFHHRPGLGHPERPERLAAIINRLDDEGLLEQLALTAPAERPEPWVRTVHTDAYIETVRRETAAGRAELSTGDTAVCRESFDVAMAAAGGAIAAVDAVLAGGASNAFCALRPPGHHAEPDRGMGFCVFNNAAVAARYAQGRYDVGKVVLVDWDVHHGNGTQATFYADASVLYFSTHLDGHYPMPITARGFAAETGDDGARGTNLNVPLPAGAGDAAFRDVFQQTLVPAAREFAPDLAIISAGFDSRQDDPLGQFRLTDAGFAKLTEIVRSLVPPGRVISVLEGGYALEGLAAASAAHVRALMGA